MSNFENKKRGLMHNANDDVCVVVEDVIADDEILVTCIEDGSILTIRATENVSANFKIAIRDVPIGGEVHEYGEVIGTATKPIVRGECVHIHNIKTTRF